MILRDYQIKALADTRALVASGKRAPLVVSPTGSGKTILESEIARLHLEKSSQNRVLVVAHRRELIGQIARTMLRLGLNSIGEIFPGAPYRANARVQVASTQTLRAREIFPQASMVIFDEAHHYSSDDYSLLASGYPNSLRVGFTATPIRSDGRGMAPSFDSMVIVSTIKELTDKGHLVPCRVIAPDKAIKSPGLACQPVDAYLEHAKGRKTVVFAQFVKDAHEFAEQFKSREIDAVVVHGTMSEDERKCALSRFDKGAVLVNVAVLTEGWDSPECSCCILARGCHSIGTYIQIAGRILRPYLGKTDALLIDLTGRAFHTHGSPDEERDYSLHGKGIRRKDEASTVFCTMCGAPVVAWPCDGCGHDPTGSKAQDPSYTGDPLAERYAAKRKEDVGQKTECLARWIAESRAKGWKPWAAQGKFKAVYGHAPGAEMVKEAMAKAGSVKVSKCGACGKHTSKTYGGLCGNCTFGSDAKRMRG